MVVFDSTVYLLDLMRTCPSIVTNHLASSVTVQRGRRRRRKKKTPLPGFSSEVTHNLPEQRRV